MKLTDGERTMLIVIVLFVSNMLTILGGIFDIPMLRSFLCPLTLTALILDGYHLIVMIVKYKEALEFAESQFE